VAVQSIDEAANADRWLCAVTVEVDGETLLEEQCLSDAAQLALVEGPQDGLAPAQVRRRRL
jgi:hypothetical protein